MPNHPTNIAHYSNLPKGHAATYGWFHPAASVFRVLFTFALAALFSGCTTIRKNYPRPVTTAWEKPEETALGRQYAADQSRHPGQSGFQLLNSGMDAFVARAFLADVAERTIDVQYYIVHGDLTGKLLMYRLLKAADRGVRVRLLLDDHHTGGRDFEMAAFDAHPNIQVRLFNPYMGRHVVMVSRPVDFLLHPSRLNRRMHNKVFVADNQVAIVGGRNLGDEYFEAATDMEFQDLDLMAVGPIAKKVSATFDDYWNSAWAVPMGALRNTHPTAADFVESCRELENHWESSQDTGFAAALRESKLRSNLTRNPLALIWAPAQVFCDPPSKIAGLGKRFIVRHMPSQLLPIAEKTQKELLLVSPYFVPGDEGMEFFHRLRARGARIRILTNALAANDSPLVHIGYSRYRKAMLQCGVELFEFKPSAEMLKRSKHRRLPRSRWTSLHTKAFVFDRQTVFIGSLNLDPRSMRLNTEAGLIVESPELANQVAALFAESVQPKNSYRMQMITIPGDPVRQTPPRKVLTWNTEEQGAPARYGMEPHAAWWRHLLTIFFSLVPLEDQI